jgi:hypothetical protein
VSDLAGDGQRLFVERNGFAWLAKIRPCHPQVRQCGTFSLPIIEFASQFQVSFVEWDSFASFAELIPRDSQVPEQGGLIPPIPKRAASSNCFFQPANSFGGGQPNMDNATTTKGIVPTELSSNTVSTPMLCGPRLTTSDIGQLTLEDFEAPQHVVVPSQETRIRFCQNVLVVPREAAFGCGNSFGRTGLHGMTSDEPECISSDGTHQVV